MDVNTVALTGRLTKDPELEHTKGGTAVTRLRIAIQRTRGPEAEDRGATFWTVQVWKGTAEAACKYLKKGSRVAIEGFLDHDEWEKDGAPRQMHYVVAKPMGVKFLDPAPKSDEESEQEPLPEAA